MKKQFVFVKKDWTGVIKETITVSENTLEEASETLAIAFGDSEVYSDLFKEFEWVKDMDNFRKCKICGEVSYKNSFRGQRNTCRNCENNLKRVAKKN